MSNPFDELPENPEDGDEEVDFEPDVATVAFLDQQQAEFGNMEEEFEATYGFKHECHCGEDYAAGRVGEITQCYHNMMQEALATCARLNAELKEVTGIAQALYSELRSRVEAEEGAGEVSNESVSDADTGEAGTPESDDGSESDRSEAAELGSIGDGAGEGLGSARQGDGDEGTPADRKLV